MRDELDELYEAARQELEDYRTLCATQKALDPTTSDQVQAALTSLIARTRQNYNEHYLLWRCQVLMTQAPADRSLPNLL
ncbi:hypothetical protein [Lacticaseibacillus brantae]|uniref:Uncharacterized protein n=1 Tax=Lacticaseibacillus brantae DSM 23927 TaxID=1423727 RepID=A0A0R2AWH6_9LACO|nr:hypothetical protein [Lacticaseibacillus brantae]KRM71752.1 hypothetical protein FC34_GL001411 [Lacticaseibacillus brantae DSM 23927]